MEELRIIVVASALAIAGLVLTGLFAAGLGTARAAAKWPSADRPRLGSVSTGIGIAVGSVLCAAAAGVGALAIPLENEFALYGAVAGAALVTLVVIAWLATLLASKVELSALINSPSPGGQEPQNPTSAMGAQAAASSPHGLRPYQQAEISYGRPYPGVVEPQTPPRGAIESSPYETEASPAPPQPSASPSKNEYEPQPDAYVDPIHTTASDHGQTTTQNAQTIGAEAEPQQVTDMVDDHAIPADAMPGWVYTDDAEDWYLVALIAGGRRLLRLTDFVIPAPDSVTGELHIAGSIEMTVWPAEPEEDEQLNDDAHADSEPDQTTGEPETAASEEPTAEHATADTKPPQEVEADTEKPDDAQRPHAPVQESRLTTDADAADTVEKTETGADVDAADTVETPARQAPPENPRASELDTGKTEAPRPEARGQATPAPPTAPATPPASPQITPESTKPSNSDSSGSLDKSETDRPGHADATETEGDNSGRHRRSRHRRGIQNFGQ